MSLVELNNSNKSKHINIKYDLVIVVYACDTINKYRNQILKIDDTYKKIILLYPNIKIIYMLGEEGVLKGEQFIHIKGVKNDYFSASYKQWFGLKYVHENYNTKFVMCIGTDTYLNIKKLVCLLNNYDYKKNLYIGGHGCHRLILNTNTYFHSGGPGFILSKGCLIKIYPKIKDVNQFVDWWINICKGTRLKTACDVAIGYLITLNDINSEVIKVKDMFYHCNYLGIPCHKNIIKMHNIVSCHNMSLTDFDNFTKILEANNYFI